MHMGGSRVLWRMLCTYMCLPMLLSPCVAAHVLWPHCVKWKAAASLCLLRSNMPL